MSDESPYEVIPQWALPAERRMMLGILFRSDTLDRKIWNLLFQPGCENRAFLSDIDVTEVDSWQIDWLADEVNYSFNDTVAGFISVRPLALRRAASRVFPVQRDGFLCGVHSLNALARSAILNPASIFDVMVAMRGLHAINPCAPLDLYAQREELVIAALREGIVLGSVLLNDCGQFASLRGADSVLPTEPNKCLEMAARAAGGLALLFSTGGGVGGHFVSIVPVEHGYWALYDTSDVVNVQAHLGDVLRYACQLRMRESDTEVVGLVPLQRGVCQTVDLWRVSTLRNLSAGQVGQTISVSAEIYTPSTLHATAVAINSLELEALDLNAFTLFAACSRFEDEMSCKANELAHCLISFVPTTDFCSLNWESAMPSERQRLDGVVINLRQLGSLIRSWIGVMFAPRDVLANRDWLRYVAIHHVARSLAIALKKDPGAGRLYRLATALSLVAHTWHRKAGITSEDVMKKYGSIDAIYKLARTRHVGDIIGSIGRSSAFEARVTEGIARETRPHHFLGKNRLDRALWLLYAARHASVDLKISDDELALLDSGRLDNGGYGDDSVPALDRLRDVAFCRPRFDHVVSVNITAKSGLIDALAADQREQSIVRRRRELMLPTFYSWIEELRVSPAAKLLAVFGISHHYWRREPIGATDAAAIIAESDELPHLIEQAMVRTSADVMYGTVFDCEHPLHTIGDRRQISRRFDLVGNDPTSPTCYELSAGGVVVQRAFSEHKTRAKRKRDPDPEIN